ncbi:hypothetical protein [Alsobacter sp. SYSU BS001988]
MLKPYEDLRLIWERDREEEREKILAAVQLLKNTPADTDKIESNSPDLDAVLTMLIRQASKRDLVDLRKIFPEFVDIKLSPTPPGWPLGRVKSTARDLLADLRRLFMATQDERFLNAVVALKQSGAVDIDKMKFKQNFKPDSEIRKNESLIQEVLRRFEAGQDMRISAAQVAVEHKVTGQSFDAVVNRLRKAAAAVGRQRAPKTPTTPSPELEE